MKQKAHEGENGDEAATVPDKKPALIAPDSRFHLLSWNNMPMWRCSVCPFDTLDGEDVIVEHYVREHVPAVPPPVVIIPVYDRFGNRIN